MRSSAIDLPFDNRRIDDRAVSLTYQIVWRKIVAAVKFGDDLGNVPANDGL